MKHCGQTQATLNKAMYDKGNINTKGGTSWDGSGQIRTSSEIKITVSTARLHRHWATCPCLSKDYGLVIGAYASAGHHTYIYREVMDQCKRQGHHFQTVKTALKPQGQRISGRFSGTAVGHEEKVQFKRVINSAQNFRWIYLVRHQHLQTEFRICLRKIQASMP